MACTVRGTEQISCLNDADELRKRGYMMGSNLGEGSYAKVKSAFSEKVNKKVALKIINCKKAPKDFQQKFLPRELEVMRMIRHPNVIQMHEVLRFNGKVFIAMEMAGHGDLLDYVKLRGAIGEDRARHMFQQLVNAVEYLHSVNIVHRDLKCENILLDTQNDIKVTDFGFARLLLAEDHSKTYCGSAAYAAPEILQGIPYKGPSYDIWSLGVILYVMVCGSMPYDDCNIKKMIKYQTERKVGFSRSRKLSQEVRDLIHSMLEPSPKNRATMTDVQNSMWLVQGRCYKKPADAVAAAATTTDVPQTSGSAEAPTKETPAKTPQKTTPAPPASTDTKVDDITKGIEDMKAT